MKVFKFGGASVSTAERIKNAGAILKQYPHEKVVVVVSAIGKTTNALEKVVEAFYQHQQQQALQLFEQIKHDHLMIAGQLIHKPVPFLTDLFTEVEWLLHDQPAKSFNYYYDQVVCIGELLSTAIVSAYLNEAGISNQWIDVRDVLRTDNNFRDARIDWEITTQKIHRLLLPLFGHQDIIITQGFIGATDANESTTLGREGSDYTAAVFANILNAESQTIWKDVQGVMNADPKLYFQAQWIEELNYKEVIEMAYYGAQVIHPKTIKPLQNKHIPLFVKSFLHPEAEGTVIHNNSIRQLPPIIVYKQNQVVAKLTSKDFSFVGEGLAAEVNQLFETLKLKPNLTQNAAISLMYVLDNIADKVEQFALAAAVHFEVQIITGLTLLTIRHYTNTVYTELTQGKKVLLEQKTPETVQVVMQE